VSANLLVVCTANIARSPLAEALFEVHARARGLDGQVGIVSAGTRARVGDAAAPPSVEIAATWGVDLRRHRSQPVSDELLERSDLVLTMTEEHRDVLSGRGARVAQRCFTVRELHRLLEDVEVAGVHVPAGAHVLVSQYVTHRDPRWFPEPERFDPWRWHRRPERELPRGAYVPFGGGNRRCLGEHFALLEARIILLAIAHHVRLAPLDPRHPVPVAQPRATYRPRGRVPMRVTWRTS